ncbi:MAG: OsmC family protein [Cyanobacteria bacterium]|nr:OsmC family protein [Cyanobacteriota bacterium]
MSEVLVKNKSDQRYKHNILVGDHSFLADAPKEHGGDEIGPAPHDLLLAALGACTSMTIRMYAERKEWPLTGVTVKLHEDKVVDPENDSRTIPHIVRDVTLEGELTDEQVEALKAIADKCPIHKLISGKKEISTLVARAN